MNRRSFIKSIAAVFAVPSLLNFTNLFSKGQPSASLTPPQYDWAKMSASVTVDNPEMVELIKRKNEAMRKSYLKALADTIYG